MSCLSGRIAQARRSGIQKQPTLIWIPVRAEARPGMTKTYATAVTGAGGVSINSSV
jgi:hypothetical protein